MATQKPCMRVTVNQSLNTSQIYPTFTKYNANPELATSILAVSYSVWCCISYRGCAPLPFVLLVFFSSHSKYNPYGAQAPATTLPVSQLVLLLSDKYPFLNSANSTITKINIFSSTPSFALISEGPPAFHSITLDMSSN